MKGLFDEAGNWKRILIEILMGLYRVKHLFEIVFGILPRRHGVTEKDEILEEDNKQNTIFCK